MFVQVIQGRVSDASAVHEQLAKWRSELAPSATGWLGTTAGVTEDGTFIALVRFESAEAAQQSSERAEQGEWWEETAKLFDGEPEFHDSTRVDVNTPGDPDQAGFVQVMQGRVTDPERSRELMNDDSIDWRGFRPDILGSLSVEHEGGAWTMALHFTSEAEAREGESKPPPPEMEAMMKEMEAISVGEPSYLDLKDPWLHSPG